MAISCSILAWNIPWTEPGGPWSTGLQRDLKHLSMHARTYMLISSSWFIPPLSLEDERLRVPESGGNLRVGVGAGGWAPSHAHVPLSLEFPRCALMGLFLTLAAAELEVGQVSEFKREPWLFQHLSVKRQQQERDWRERVGVCRGEGLLFSSWKASAGRYTLPASLAAAPATPPRLTCDLR